MDQHDLFSDLPDDLPSQSRFPCNEFDRYVKIPVEEDLKGALNPLIITGYTSLKMLIDFLAVCYASEQSPQHIRILLGHEPNSSTQQVYSSSRHRFSQEVTDYWLDHGISITLCGKVLAAIELLKTGILTTRISHNPNRPVHAKIYLSEQAATIGSSNFSHFGFYAQTEGNARFSQKDEPERFFETRQLAEHIWNSGTGYNLQNLLEQLLHEVTWEEAIARACAEVLEGNWAKRYITSASPTDQLLLWPSQVQGIAQAMWVIENIGSVLIADATGSGKTRMASHLMRHIADHIARTGRMRRDLHVLLCPPSVRKNWQRELDSCGHNVRVFSSGLLSQTNGKEYEVVKQAVRRAQVLAADEAHHFFNRSSLRTQAIYVSLADYVILLTATPINKGPNDLLAIIDLLGADNFDDEVLDVLKPLWRQRADINESMSPSQRELLQRAIQRFTVRRTKTMLNTCVSQEPERYRDCNGRQCRFPKHEPHYYTCNETESDCQIASLIREQTQHLRGLINLRTTLRLSKAQRIDQVEEADYLRWRLQGAKGLAGHSVASSLRSSCAALMEHLCGTEYARRYFDLDSTSKPEATGNVIERLEKMAGEPPGHELQIDVPPWLVNADAHRKACKQESTTYRNILALAQKLSPAREEAKSALLGDLLMKHPLVLAFDHHPITLYDLKQRLMKKKSGEVVVATGSNATERSRVNQLFRHGSEARNVIALCSDAMSEGINLQAASAVVHLDMPTVVRQAEQRVGRVDRMDSEHSVIEAYWPKDSTEFTLRSDERFYERYQFMADLIGSNMPLPRSPRSKIITPEEIMAEMNHVKSWDGLEDAFAPIRSLISGDNMLIPKVTYDQIRTSTTRVISAISAVQSVRHWAFFAVAGTEWGAPRWVYLDDIVGKPVTDLEQIVQHLRVNLTLGTLKHALDEKATNLLSRFVSRLAATEHLLLPQKKQRAIDEMRIVLKAYHSGAQKNKDISRLNILQELLEHIDIKSNSSSVDLTRLAERWFDIIRPVWNDCLGKKRYQPLRLKDIRTSLIKESPISTDHLQGFLQAISWVKPLEDRVIAAIIGVA